MAGRRATTPDVLLYQLLDACAATKEKQVADTGHIVCCTPLIRHLAREVFDYEDQPFDEAALRDAFLGQPVKQVWAVCRSYLRSDDPVDWSLAIRKRGRKRRGEGGEAA